MRAWGCERLGCERLGTRLILPEILATEAREERTS